MSTGMTTIGSPEIEEYCEAVRVALADLPGPLRDDLIEDLPDHLAEVLAEGDGSLRDRLGEPAAYADELRAAAGLEPASDDAAGGGWQAGLVSAARRSAEVGRRLDGQLGRPIGYTRLSDLLRAVRPGWWVLRGWIVAQFAGGVRGHRGWHGVIPQIGGNHVVGLLATLALIAASVWLGRRSLRFTVWPRRIVVGLSIVIAVWAATVLTSSVTDSAYGFSGSSATYIGPTGPDVNDVYVYDQNGNPVPGARLFDQDGNPIQLGSGLCNDGNLAPGTDPEATDNGADPSTQQWTYPLCPSDPGPFRSGPGPVTTPATGDGATPSDGAAPSSAGASSAGASSTGASSAGTSGGTAGGASAAASTGAAASGAASTAPKATHGAAHAASSRAPAK